MIPVSKTYVPSEEKDLGNPSSSIFRAGDLVTSVAVTLLILILAQVVSPKGITFDDSPALAVAAWSFGVPQPPGYPVWTILAGTFAHLFPAGTIASRLVAFSSMGTALACGLVTWSVTRTARQLHHLKTRQAGLATSPGPFPRLGGIAAGLVLGLGQTTFHLSVQISTHPLTLALLTGLLALSIEAVFNPRRTWMLPAAALLLGLGLTNDHRLVLAIPGIQVLWILADLRRGRDMLLLNAMLGLGISWLVSTESLAASTFHGPLLTGVRAWAILSLVGFLFIAWHTRSIGSRLPQAALLFFGCLLGLTPFLVLPFLSFNNPPMDWGYTRTWSGFLLHLTRAQYPSLPVSLDWPTVRLLVEQATHTVSPIAIAAALIPGLLLSRAGMQRQFVACLFLLTLSLFVLPALVYQQRFVLSDPQSHSALYLPSIAMFAFLVGLGTASISNQQDRGTATLRPLDFLALASLLIWVISFPNTERLTFVKQLLRLIPPLLLFVAVLLTDLRPFAGLLTACSAILGSIWLQVFLRPFHEGSHAQATAHSILAPPGLDPLPQNSVFVAGTDFTRFAAEYVVHCEDPLSQTTLSNRTDIAVVAGSALSNPEYLAGLRARYNPSSQTNVGFFQSRLDPEYMVRTSSVPMSQGITGWLDTRLISRAADADRRRRIPVPAVQPADIHNPNALTQRIRNGSRPVDLSLREALDPLPETADAVTLAEKLNLLMEDEAWYAPERFPDETLPDTVRSLGLQNPVGPSRALLNRLLLSAAYPDLVRQPTAGIYPVLELNLPREEDRRNLVGAYFTDARIRAESGKLGEGEIVTRLSDGTFSIGGPAALAHINGQLVRLIVQLNPDRPFFLDSAVTYPWIESRILPHGLLFQLHAEPVTDLPIGILEADHAFWSTTTRTLLGHAFDVPLSVDQLMQTVRNQEADGRQFPPRERAGYIADPKARSLYSRMRLGSALSFYLPRARTMTNSVLQVRLRHEAELALQQALLFDPTHSAAIRALVRSWMDDNRTEQARVLLADRLRIKPSDQVLQSLSNSMTPTLVR
jgi:hypothetical protein